MKLAEVFKQAITNADWDRVCDVYQAITGETIEPPQVKVFVEEPQAEPVSLADIEMDNEPKKAGRQGKKKSRRLPEDVIAPSKGKVKNRAGKRQARREPMSAVGHDNRFHDDQKAAHKDIAIDKLLSVKAPLPRGNRTLLDIDAENTGHKITVECSQCGVIENISPALAHGYDPDPKENVWKCNECCTPSGRAEDIRRRRNDG